MSKEVGARGRFDIFLDSASSHPSSTPLAESRTNDGGIKRG